eukprot:TRINITY_DN25077_c0_g1_i4.p1 TRINITY_DN25077_c0_g1~~TRINITY_DN25077_c0_g1_i4.p1  ORF type:complete len:269 (+),score=35.74 TRINITY_DN25077_c0_g1_i4:196-1002(+)
MSEHVIFTASSLSGDRLFGPKPVDSSATIEDVQLQIATATDQSAFVLRLMHKGRMLGASEKILSLADGGAENEVELMVCTSSAREAASARYAECLAQIKTKCCCEMRDVETLPNEKVEAALSGIKEAIKVASLPEELEAWLFAMMVAPVHIEDYKADFEFLPSDFVSEMEDKVESDGLIFINQFGDNDNVLAHFVDVLGRMTEDDENAESMPGAVWFMNVWDDVWDMDEPFSLDMCKLAKNGEFHGMTFHVDTRPTKVANSLADFFQR